MKIVADDKIPFLKGVFEPFAKVDYLPGDQITVDALKTADALLIRSITKCNENLLKDTSVKFIATATIGDDHIDKHYCAENEIQWSSAKGCNALAVEQYVTTALLLLARNHNLNLKDQTIGIIGVGSIGSKIARVAKLFRMKVLLNDPPRARNEGSGKFVSVKLILEKADIISLHVPITKMGEDKTLHLANENFFHQLKRNCIFINTSRGEVVDSFALKQALMNGVVKHTIIDVWENEPDISPELLDLVEIATPHVAGYSLSGKAKGTSMAVHAVSKYFNLGLDNWYPAISVERKTIEIDGSELSDQEIIYKIYNQVYSIRDDDEALRNSVNHFEKLRREYVFRNENNFFNLKIKNVKSELIYLLKKLGFIIQTNNQ